MKFKKIILSFENYLGINNPKLFTEGNPLLTASKRHVTNYILSLECVAIPKEKLLHYIR